MFEHTHPCCRACCIDLTESTDTPGAIRRTSLADLVQRLGLFRQIITTPYGHDVLSALQPMDGGPSRGCRRVDSR